MRSFQRTLANWTATSRATYPGSAAIANIVKNAVVRCQFFHSHQIMDRSHPAVVRMME